MVSDECNCILVTPVYKDAARLAQFGPRLAEALADQQAPVRWVIADDGSGDAACRQLEQQAEACRRVFPHVEVFRLDRHRGKGAVVRESWAHYAEQSVAWLAFVDADGAISADTILGLLQEAIGLGPGHAVLGARIKAPHTRVVRHPLRLLAGVLFSRLARTMLGLPVRDVQCGAKVVGRSDFQAIAPRLLEDGMAFDSELLHALRMHGTRLVTSPIDWIERPSGNVRPLHDAWPMVKAVFRVRRRSRAGHYTDQPPAATE